MKSSRTWVVLLGWAFAAGSLVYTASCSSSSSQNQPGIDAGAPDATAAKPDAGIADGGSDGGGVGTACDPVSQDCADPTLKCTYTKGSNGDVPTCQASIGDAIAQLSESCQRDDLGIDNCVEGTICFPDGADGTYACRKACSKDSDCDTSAMCARVTSGTTPFGVCYPTCTPFGTDCSSGTCANYFLDNDAVTSFDGCRTAGAEPLGGTCTTQWSCEADMYCVGSSSAFTCHAMCDGAHPCADAGVCAAKKGFADGGGYCQ